ncbi:MAG: hypothetical protein ACREBU_02945 [Nitrososphaera sp.]
MTVEFGSLLSYSPRGWSTVQQQSRSTMNALKDDEFVMQPPVLMSSLVGDLVHGNLDRLPFAHFFINNPILVPTPKSSLMQEDTLWVPNRLAHALLKRGLGKAVNECLKRVIPLQKSATSPPEDRPKADDHLRSMSIQKILPEPKEILLIDDVVTRGATLLGAANKLADVFPTARIRAFAAMRTVSNPDEFDDIYDPRRGSIELIGVDTFRNP